MNQALEIKILKKNWLRITNEEKEILINRKTRENQYLPLTVEVNKQRVGIVEKKFVNAILRAEKASFNWAEKFPLLKYSEIVDDSEIIITASFTSLQANLEDELQATVFEQEIVFSDFKKLVTETKKGYEQVFEKIFNPCFFSNNDLLDITHVKVIIKVNATMV